MAELLEILSSFATMWLWRDPRDAIDTSALVPYRGCNHKPRQKAGNFDGYRTRNRKLIEYSWNNLSNNNSSNLAVAAPLHSIISSGVSWIDDISDAVLVSVKLPWYADLSLASPSRCDVMRFKWLAYGRRWFANQVAKSYNISQIPAASRHAVHREHSSPRCTRSIRAKAGQQEKNIIRATGSAVCNDSLKQNLGLLGYTGIYDVNLSFQHLPLQASNQPDLW